MLFINAAPKEITMMIKITRKASDRKQALSTIKAMEALGGQRIETAAYGHWESKDGDLVFPGCEGVPVRGWGRNGAVHAMVDGQKDTIKPLGKSAYGEAGHFEISCWLPDYA